MFKCCICGRQLFRASSWVCGQCARQFHLGLLSSEWPAWAQAELARERQRRRFAPNYGVSSEELNPRPYRRHNENQDYRRANHLRKRAGPRRRRVGADNLFYSSIDDVPRPGIDYGRMLGSMPSELRDQLDQNTELQVILRDALRSLPLISRRAIIATAAGRSVQEIAQAEGIPEATMRWLIESARERLRDVLSGRPDGDDGQRFR